MTGPIVPRELYDALTDDLLYDPVVERSTMMGHPGVRRAGQHFAAFDTHASALAVRLAPDRVTELLADGAAPFAPNGRPLREWVAVRAPDPAVWEALLAEAGDVAAAAAKASRAAIDELADRIREVLADLAVAEVREQRMFGGLAFLVAGHIAVGASREGGIMLNVGREAPTLLGKPHTWPMVMRGKPLDGWIRVTVDGLRTKRQLAAWVRRGVASASTR